MVKKNFLMLSAATVAVVLAASALQTADAQRKSIRWSTSSINSYGYKVAATMVKIAEEALGGEYTVTVNPVSLNHRRDEGRDGWQWRDRLHGRRRHDRSFMAVTAASRTTRRARASWSTPGTPIRWNPSWRCPPTRPRIQVPEGSLRQADLLHAGRLHELARTSSACTRRSAMTSSMCRSIRRRRPTR